MDYVLPDRIVVRQGEHVTLGQITVPRGVVSLAVYPWARVAVDGRQEGVTPISPIELLPGAHRVTLSCGDGRGPNTVERRVRVEASQTIVVRHRFESWQ